MVAHVKSSNMLRGVGSASVPDTVRERDYRVEIRGAICRMHTGNFYKYTELMGPISIS